MPTIRVRGVDLAFDESGPSDGPVVALLHGALASASAWPRARERLAARGFRALALDDRGHGRSQPFGTPGNPWSALAMDTLREDAAAWLDAVAPGRVHLVGHSRGATVAAWLALDRPGKVASVALAASPPMASEAFRAFHRALLARAKRPEGSRGELAEATWRWLSEIDDGDFPAEAMTQIRAPALVLEAGDDPLYSPTHTMFWRAWMKHARVERLDSGGHNFPFDDGTGEAWFHARLLEHLEAAASAEARR